MKFGIISLFFLFICSLFPSQYCAQVYNITPSQPLAQGQTLVSPGQVFELGFFSPNNSANKYVGLWHKNIFPRKVVWVANRENPLAVTDQLASLRFGKNGNLELVDGKQTSVWSIIISVSNNGTAAVLLDSGTFVLKDDRGADLWQSLDYPSDSLLPGMKLGFDSNSGKWNFLTSWKSENDPSTGIFSVGLSAQIPTQIFMWKNGSTPCWRTGPWDKSKFIGIPTMNSQYLMGITLDENAKQGTRYFSYSNLGDNTVSYFDISSQGMLTYMVSESGMKNWSLRWQGPDNICDSYGACGPFGVYKAADSPICKCLKGFIPKSDKEWIKRNWSGGCVRRTNLFCERHTNKSVSSIGKEDGFLKMEGIKVPDFHEYPVSVALDKFENCKIQCLTNCSCVAYTFVNVIGCLVWFKDLIDVQEFPSSGVDLYIRLAHSELGGEGKPIKLISSLAAIGIMSILVAIIFGLHWLRANRKGHINLTTQRLELTGLLREYRGKHDPLELKVYDFNSILIATDNFSFTNKLGQGGFGPVYKGMLPDGKEIAVKRLSSSSGQGVEEFKNEMMLISNLQHKNLVRIMGCCVKEDEKLLIYEFMPNKSLDTFLYDPTKRAAVLDWTTRFSIIQGVAKGLLYLHHDSYVKVIHRDLKVSNILLDDKMNPKISDFGLARIVEGTQLLENTQKVVGTRGYMSPEYAMCGIFSEKSDIYSFGVLVLEIISSKKNTSFCLYDQQQGFLAYAWNLWNEGKGLVLVDEVLGDSYSSSEVMRCVQIGLLCVQDNAVDRPTMHDVVLMLSSETDGPQPKQPIFTIQNSIYHPQPHYGNTNSSKNEATITLIEGR